MCNTARTPEVSTALWRGSTPIWHASIKGDSNGDTPVNPGIDPVELGPDDEGTGAEVKLPRPDDKLGTGDTGEVVDIIVVAVLLQQPGTSTDGPTANAVAPGPVATVVDVRGASLHNEPDPANTTTMLGIVR